MSEELQIVAVGKNVEAQYVEMMVPLYSLGCERKIKKALSSLKGIYSVNVDYNQQKVTVWGICDKYDVLSIVKSKRKGACFWDCEDNILLLQDSSHSHSAPSSPQPSSRYLSLSLNLSLIKNHNWKKTLKKAFTRSYSF